MNPVQEDEDVYDWEPPNITKFDQRTWYLPQFFTTKDDHEDENKWKVSTYKMTKSREEIMSEIVEPSPYELRFCYVTFVRPSVKPTVTLRSISWKNQKPLDKDNQIVCIQMKWIDEIPEQKSRTHIHVLLMVPNGYDGLKPKFLILDPNGLSAKKDGLGSNLQQNLLEQMSKTTFPKAARGGTFKIADSGDWNFSFTDEMQTILHKDRLVDATEEHRFNTNAAHCSCICFIFLYHFLNRINDTPFDTREYFCELKDAILMIQGKEDSVAYDLTKAQQQIVFYYFLALMFYLTKKQFVNYQRIKPIFFKKGGRGRAPRRQARRTIEPTTARVAEPIPEQPVVRRLFPESKHPPPYVPLEPVAASLTDGDRYAMETPQVDLQLLANDPVMGLPAAVAGEEDHTKIMTPAQNGKTPSRLLAPHSFKPLSSTRSIKFTPYQLGSSSKIPVSTPIQKRLMNITVRHSRAHPRRHFNLEVAFQEMNDESTMYRKEFDLEPPSPPPPPPPER